MKQIKKGFTLLELLVVIGIIAVLTGLGTVSYSTVQRKARDAKRKEDINSLQKCFEQYYAYNNNFKYPVITNDTRITTADIYNCDSSASPKTVSIQDPLEDGSSIYKYSLTSTAADGSTYTLCADTLETETVNYCVDSQQ